MTTLLERYAFDLDQLTPQEKEIEKIKSFVHLVLTNNFYENELYVCDEDIKSFKIQDFLKKNDIPYTETSTCEYRIDAEDVLAKVRELNDSKPLNAVCYFLAYEPNQDSVMNTDKIIDIIVFEDENNFTNADKYRLKTVIKNSHAIHPDHLREFIKDENIDELFKNFILNANGGYTYLKLIRKTLNISEKALTNIYEENDL